MFLKKLNWIERNVSKDGTERRKNTCYLVTPLCTQSRRVTRLGDFFTFWANFSPIGRLLTLGSFLKMTDIAQFWAYFFHAISCVLIWTEMELLHFRKRISSPWSGLGYIFTNSSLVTLIPFFPVSSPGLPDGLFSNPKSQIWGNFGGPLNGKCWYIS
jgi:hypothetical protein